MERDDRINLDSCAPPTLREASEDGRVHVAFRVKSGRLTAIIVPDTGEPQFTDVSHALFLSMVHDDVVSFDVDIDTHSDREEGDLC
jgi:predicted secreted protein